MGYDPFKEAKSFVSDPLGYVTGSSAAEEEAAKARGELTAGREAALGDIGQYYGQAAGQLQPLSDLYGQNIGQYTQQAQTGLDPAAAQLQQLQRMPRVSQDVPQFGFDMQADPVFQFQQREMENALARRMAGGGRLASSDALNALTRGTMDLAGRYGQEAFGRAATGYGFDVGRSNIMAERNRQQFGRGQQLFGNQLELAGQQFNRMGGLVGLGVQGRNALANLYQSQGNVRSGIQTGTASQLAGNLMDVGGLKVATSPLNTLATLGSIYANVTEGPT